MTYKKVIYKKVNYKSSKNFLINFVRSEIIYADLFIFLPYQGDYFNKDGIHLIAIDITKTFTLEDYIEYQKDTIHTAKEDLLKLRCSVLDLATSVCYVS